MRGCVWRCCAIEAGYVVWYGVVCNVGESKGKARGKRDMRTKYLSTREKKSSTRVGRSSSRVDKTKRDLPPTYLSSVVYGSIAATVAAHTQHG